MAEKLLGVRVALHDVRDVEALCWSALERVLAGWGAYLSREKKERCVRELLKQAWLLSGLDERGKPRTAWVVESTVVVAGAASITRKTTTLYDPEVAAQVERIARLSRVRTRSGDQEIQVALVVRRCTPPPGCYDPELARELDLSFSTYATRILKKRVVDWYRMEFGDDRYERPAPDLSLEQVSESSGVSIAELVGPDPFLDEEEVLTNEAVAG